MKKLDIIIPVYNESENIGAILQKIQSSVKTPHTVIIIYDFDDDPTVQVVLKLKHSFRNMVLIKNRYGKCI